VYVETVYAKIGVSETTYVERRMLHGLAFNNRDFKLMCVELPRISNGNGKLGLWDLWEYVFVFKVVWVTLKFAEL
jgi:hypothetical protein